MIRRILRIACLAIALLACLPGHAVARLRGRREGRAQRFLAMAARACGVDVRIVGRPLTRDILLVANHLSWLDILVLGGATGASFVSKDAVARWPLVGFLARQGGTIFINRGSRTAARGQIETIAAALQRHRPVALFPEGTTGDGVALLPFRGALFAAAGTGIGVQPVAIDYGSAATTLAWRDGEGAAANALRILGRRGRIGATLHFLDPLDPAEHADRKALAQAARTAIAGALSKVSQEHESL